MKTDAERQALDRVGKLFIVDVVTMVALDVATTEDGRALGVSVESWPRQQGVWLRARCGQELHIFTTARGDAVRVRWDATEPTPMNGAITTAGEIGVLDEVSRDRLHAFIWGWLACMTTEAAS